MMKSISLGILFGFFIVFCNYLVLRILPYSKLQSLNYILRICLFPLYFIGIYITFFALRFLDTRPNVLVSGLDVQIFEGVISPFLLSLLVIFIPQIAEYSALKNS